GLPRRVEAHGASADRGGASAPRPTARMSQGSAGQARPRRADPEGALNMGRRRLTLGMPRIFRNHRNAAGRRYRQEWSALTTAFDLMAPLARRQASLVALAFVNLAESTAVLVDLRARRATGQGRV